MRYRVKSAAGTEIFVDLMSQRHEGYEIKITTITERSEKEVREFISRHLFDACIRTGYLSPVQGNAKQHRAAHSA
jgi:hypothetical protein